MFDIIALIKTVGYLGVAAIVFAESGLFICFVLPGDSLLFTAGFLASQGFLNPLILIAVVFPAAVLGDNFGYAFGRRVGPKIFTREDSLLFHKENLERARMFYEYYGAKTIVLARFLPIIRTLAPILAGVGKMRYATFFAYNLIGGALWGIGITLLGYFLGAMVSGIDRYLAPIILLLIFVYFLPTFIHVLKDRTYRTRIIAFLKK